MTLATATLLLLRYCGPLSRPQIEAWAEACGWAPIGVGKALRALARAGLIEHRQRAAYRRPSLYGVRHAAGD